MVSDLLGRIVLARRIETGEGSVVWNGRDAHDDEAVSGIYFVRLTTNRSVTAIKLILLNAH
jgi:hypothetical protein